jgi:hypothetical protein
MLKHRLGAMALMCAFIGIVAASCDSGGKGGSGGGGAGASGGSGGNGGGGGNGGSGGGALQWYTTCGDPSCVIPDGGSNMPPAGVSPCTTEKEGDACTTSGATCWPGGNCGVLLVCATSDPKDSPGGCPISRASHKKDIEYLSEGELASLHDDVMAMRLASWRYKAEPEGAREHVGFIIDDAPGSAAVAASGERVDLYGYTSMAVAAAQVQDRRIDALSRELAALRDEVTALRQKASQCEAEGPAPKSAGTRQRDAKR